MKIALLADIHANLPALQKVVKHAREQGVDEFWNLGDIVGYAPFPEETVSFLKEMCTRHVAGNYDRKAISGERIAALETSGKDPAKVFSFVWTHKNLSLGARLFIESLPERVHLEIDGYRILLVHASPRDMEEGVTMRTSASRLVAMAEKAQADMILCAHTHRSLERHAGGVLFVNPGSVGRPFDGDPRAAYAILEVSGRKATVQHFRVPYSQDEMIRVMEQKSFPEKLIHTLTRASSLDDIDGDEIRDADKAVKAALELARECRYEKEHAHQVTKLALRLFEELEPLHGLGLSERLLLQVAALLHDTGLVYGVDAHHKASRDIILKADHLPLTDRERTMAALVARYHRKSRPQARHRYYQDLSSYDQEIVDVLAGILRVADGLDRRHQGRVKDVAVVISPDTISMKIHAEDGVCEEREFAKIKADLLEQVFDRALVV